MHPDDIHLTAVMTPLGLYKWLAMPMGLRNAPPIHQWQMMAALCKYIGKICHIDMDDIMIRSDSVAEHAHLYCNPKKCEFFLLELDFLGHHISARGVEANSSKVDKILNWPVPKNTTNVHSFLGLVRYISTYLPKLAEHTRVLTPLTMKESCKSFPL
jgi:hypothetical protein